MNNMIDVTVIVPIIKFDEDKAKLFQNAISSVDEGIEIIVVGNKEALDSIDTSKCTVLENTGDTSYAAQVNFAVKEVKTKYFTVLEYDDTFSKIWFKNVDKYEKVDTENTFGFLPLTEVVDYATHETIGYANEAYWATSFSDEVGYLDINSLDGYINFNVSGGLFKTSDFISLGGLKESMKLVFWYEFLMRALYKQKKIFVIPKVGYYHEINRPDSITNTYASTMTSKEADWWVDLAKKEYFFPHDRNKTYEEE